MSALEAYGNLFDDIMPWCGPVPRGFAVDFFGTLIDLRFRRLLGVDPEGVSERIVRTKLPTIGNYGEGWFEAANWVLAANEAKNRFVMMTLGACFGYQAVGAFKAVQALSPMPCKLVVVEPEPQNLAWARQHFSDNYIDPSDHWFVPMALSDTSAPVFFPVGSPGTGAHNLMWSNHESERRIYFHEVMNNGNCEKVLQRILLENATGITRDITGRNNLAEIRLVSAVTLMDLIAPFELVDYIEADIQMSEIIVFPPAIDVLNRRVKRVHIGTHGDEAHLGMRKLFVENGWDVVFDFSPMKSHQTALGSFEANDGILTVRNPRL